MDKIGLHIKKAREDAGLTQEELGLKYGTSGVYISQWERGKRNISTNNLKKLAHILNKPVAWFLSDEAEPSQSSPPRPLSSILREAIVAQERLAVREVPIMGRISAGTLKVSEQKLDGYIPIPIILLPKVNKEFYALTIEGDSLTGDDIHDGDTVIIEPDPEYIDNKIYICKIDHELVARHVKKQKNKMRLEASNGNYSVIEPSQVELQGRVVLKGRWNKV